MIDEIKALKRLDDLRIRHRDLDEQIQGLSHSPLNELMVRRLKQEKLKLRDEITQLEQLLYPDIIA